MDGVKFFSESRLKSYISEQEHKDNFSLMQALAPKLAILEIVTRNLAFAALRDTNKIAVLASYAKDEEIDDRFISKQTFGFWAKIIDEARIHNELADFTPIDFRKYSKFNKKVNWLNFQKVKIVYNLAVCIRNRAFHLENLYKLNDFSAPRISTRLNNKIIGVMPSKLQTFLDDILDCFDIELKSYLD